jgi:RNA polymerase sigma-70 factor (ECF subfamily)
LGITPGGSKSQLFKARAKLRRLLAPLVDQRASNGGFEGGYGGNYEGSYAAQ